MLRPNAGGDSVLMTPFGAASLLWFDCLKSCGVYSGYVDVTSDSYVSETLELRNLVWVFCLQLQTEGSIQYTSHTFCTEIQLVLSCDCCSHTSCSNWRGIDVVLVFNRRPHSSQKRMSLHCKRWHSLCNMLHLLVHTSHSVLLQYSGKGIVSILWLPRITSSL